MSKIKGFLGGLTGSKRQQIMYAFEQGIEQTVEEDGYIFGVNVYDRERYKGLELVDEAGVFVLYRRIEGTAK